MPGYNFTDRVRYALQAAREEADTLRQGYVGTEHLLLGLLRVPDSTAAAMLTELGVSLTRLRDSVLELLPASTRAGVPGPDLPYTSRGKKVLELSMVAARDLGHGYVGTEHVLLGLLREGKGIAAQVLAANGLSIDKVAAEADREWDTPERQGTPSAFASGVRPSQTAAYYREHQLARLALGLATVALAVALIALAVSLG